MDGKGQIVSSPAKISLEDFFKTEYESDIRHEYRNGTVLPMAYASERHELIVANLIRLIGNCILESDCLVYGSNLMLYIPFCNRTFYPDVTLACGKRTFHQYSENMRALLNPTALIEVSSDSTVDKDRIDKWRCYKKISSLQQYLLISQEDKYIQILNRNAGENSWLETEADNDDDAVTIGNCKILVKDIYRNIIFEQGEKVSD